MPLPIIQHPVYEVYLKSLDKKVKFRPFLVKEEKIMLMVKESNEPQAIVNAIKQIISNCCVDDIDVEALPTFDVEMFFVHLRMRSIGEKVVLNFTCDKPVAGSNEPCGMVNEYELDLEKITYVAHKQHTNDIKLSDSIGIKMKYPRLSGMAKLMSKEDSMELIADNVDYIYDNDQVYDRSQYTKEELVSFLDNLTNEQVNKLLDFFIYSPKAVIKDTATCSKCSQEHKIHSEELYSFFI